MEFLRKYAPILHTGFANTYTPEQMRAFVDWCAEMGYAGFSAEGKAHPPTNNIECWAEGYLRGIRAAAEACELRGLELWLFDEWGYPSGTAGGKTLEGHPEYRCKRLYMAVDVLLKQGETLRVTAPETFLSAAAWPIHRATFGAAAGESVRVLSKDGALEYTATRRRERFCAVAYAYEGHQANGIFIPDPDDDRQGNLDTLSWEATRRYLDVMHERYAKAMPGHFGKSILGFFYDEPYLPFPNPYTFDLPEEFEKVKGYDIMPRLPQMVAGLDKEAERDWRDVCTTRMAQAFFGQMRRWCHDHGLALVGHQDLDHDVRALDSVSGNFFKNSMENDAPGVDYIWDQLYPGHFADFPRFAGSVKHLSGKAHALSESFAATGRCLHPDYMRWAMEYQMLRGIDKFYLMIADADINADGFRSPFGAKHPLSQHFGYLLNERVALSNQMLSEATPAASVALYVPMQDIGAAYPPVLPNRISLHMPWDWVNATAEALCYAPVDFEYLWDEALDGLALERGALVAESGQRIDTVVIPAVERLPEKALDRLAAFARAGGRIVCVCAVPRGLIGLAEVVVLPEDIVAAVAPSVKLTQRGRISVATRRSGEDRLFFLLNEDRNGYEGELAFPGAGHLSEFDYETKSWYAAECGAVHFAPMQLCVFRQSPGAAEKARPRLGEPVEVVGWTAYAPDGGAVALDALKDWRTFIDPTYVGFVAYETVIDVQEEGTYRVDLGRVCYSAIAQVDERAFKLPFAPHGFDAPLTRGRHTLRVQVMNTAVNEMLGSADAERAATSREYSLSYASYESTRFANDRFYLTSGMLGPVTLARYLS